MTVLLVELGRHGLARFGVVLLLGVLVGLPSVRADELSDRLQARVQLHRNAPRGMEFVPLASATPVAGVANEPKASLDVDVMLQVDLDGSAIDNVYGNVLPLDADGDGIYGYLHYNGFNYMQAFDPAGRRLWRVKNPGGRTNSVEAATHRDGAAILDLRGTGGDDILQCWSQGGRRLLIARRGDNGGEIKRVELEGNATSVGSVCYISVYRMQSTGQQIVLVAHSQRGGRSVCGGKNYVDYWARVVAFDTALNKLWESDTCNAGHKTAEVDENGDGLAEYFFVGKYALDANGKIRCSLQGWDPRDHVDGIQIGKLDPSRPGIQAVAVGETGTAAFSANDCRRLWTLSSSVVKNPQEVALAQFDPPPKPLSIVVTQRGSEPNASTYLIDPDGRLVRDLHKRLLPMQNAELDGDVRTDELLGLWGFVWNRDGRTILNRDWYFGLKGTSVALTGKRDYDRWAPFPVLFDVDGDGKKELIVWGQSLIVVGKPH